MPHFDRGVYEPNDDLRVFDGAEEEEDVEGSRLPLLIVLALLVLAMFAGVVWLAYTQGVARGRTETPILTAQSGPARIAPQNPGGVEQPYKGFKIYEQPAPPDEDTDNAQQAQPAAASSPPPVPVAAPSVPPVAVAAAKPVVPVTAPVVAPKPVPAAPKPAPVAAAKPAAPAARPDPIQAELAKAARAEAAPPPSKEAPAKASPGLATAPPRALVPAVTAPAATAPAAASGGYVLQIGAYKSQADAETAWKAYKAKHAALLAGANSDIQQADLGAKGTWYRLRIAGFSNRDVASALCDRLKADGGGCFLGK